MKVDTTLLQLLSWFAIITIILQSAQWNVFLMYTFSSGLLIYND